MKDITRIHIAKVSYDIEISAKKDLEHYIKKLELYANDAEILEDIEIRITELLAGRGVAKDGVIATDDVQALRKQLGEPEEFMDDADSTVKTNVKLSTDTKRKLFRDTDDAFLGGVLSGIAQYLSIKSIWTRLAFIVLFAISAGTITFVYLVLWIVVPPAKTAAEKLQMKGETVTLDAIKQESSLSSESETPESKRPGVVIARVILGFGFVALAMAALLTVILATISVSFSDDNWTDAMKNNWTIAAFCLAVVSGMLLAILGGLAAFASFTWRLSRKIIISASVIVLLGIVTFSIAAGIGITGLRLEKQAIEANKVTNRIELPKLANAKGLTIDVKNIRVTYEVTSDQPYVKVVTASENKKTDKISMVRDGSRATIKISEAMGCDADKNYLCFANTSVTIYGPQLDSIDVVNGTVDYFGKTVQELTLTTRADASATLSGAYSKLNVFTETDSSVDVTAASVHDARVSMKSLSNVELGNVKNLTVAQPTSCPIDQSTELSVESVAEETMTYNGKSVNIESYESACGTVEISE